MKGRRAWSIGIDLLVLAILFLTAAAVRGTSESVTAAQNERLADQAATTDAALEQKFRAYEQVLLGTRALFLSTGAVSRQTWTSYVDSLRLDERYPGIKSLAFLAAVPTDKVADFTAAVRREQAPAELVAPWNLAEFAIRPLDGNRSAQPMSAPILYIAPSTPDNNRAIGADPMQEATRRAALKRAAETDDVAVTTRVYMGRFGPDGSRLDDRVGILAYLAVSDHGRLVGWVTAAFRTQEIVTGLADKARGDAVFEILDADGGLLYSTDGVDSAGAPIPLAHREGGVESELGVADQHWHVRHYGVPSAGTTAETIAPGLVGFCGIVLALLVALIGRSGAGWRARATLLERSEAEIRHQAMHDQLTELPNRTLFHSRLRGAVAANTPFVVCYIDIDGFKTVNDEFGHRIGDALLVAIAGRLSSHVGHDDTAARLGGDEFAILVRSGVGEAFVAATELVRHLSAPYSLSVDGADHLVDVGASVGLARYPEDGTSGEQLIHAADVAMLDAKRAGRGRVSLASPPHRSHGGLTAVPDPNDSLV